MEEVGTTFILLMGIISGQINYYYLIRHGLYSNKLVSA